MDLNRALTILAKQMMHRDVHTVFLADHRNETGTPLGEALALAQACATESLGVMSEQDLGAQRDRMHWWHARLVDPAAVAVHDPIAVDQAAFALVCHRLAEVLSPLTDALRPEEEQDDVVGGTLPELADRVDDDGLLLLGGEVRPTHCAVLYRDWVLHYSQFLRRYYTSNPNLDFLFLLSQLPEREPGLSVRVAIDRRRLTTREYYRQILEEDYWRGPHLAIDTLDDPSVVGLTVHGRADDPDGLLAMFYPLLRAEILTHMQAQNKVVEFEEVVPLGEDPPAMIISKYVHSLRDTNAKQFTHLDGAVRWYRREDYQTRVDGDLRQARELSQGRRKLFRVDGPIPDDLWADLICYFYRGNELVREYLDGLDVSTAP